MMNLFASLFIAGVVALPTLQADIVHANFHLAVAAHLGAKSLDAGDYQITVSSENSGLKHVMIEGPSGFAYAFPMPVEKDAPTGPSSLQLVESDGTYYIKEYRSQYTGKVYAFSMPKRLHNVHTQVVQITN